MSTHTILWYNNFTFKCQCPLYADGINPEDLIDEQEVIQTQPATDYHAIDDGDKQPIASS